MNKLVQISGLILAVVLLGGCAESAGREAVRNEQVQQGAGVLAIVQNQPIPDLGGWSLEREIVRKTYLARNTTMTTYTYVKNLDGTLIELCASIGYPIPYSTQLSNPEQAVYSGLAIPNPEPNSLYPPDNSAATLVQCVNDDGTVSPMYIEDNVMAMPFRVKADRVLERVDEQTSFSVDITK